MNIRIYYEDTDAGGVVYHANYLKFCERARSEIFFSKGKLPCKDDCHFVVYKMEANWKKSLRFGDEAVVKTYLLECKRASLIMKQVIYKDNEIMFEAISHLAFTCGQKAVKIDDEMREFFISHVSHE